MITLVPTHHSFAPLLFSWRQEAPMLRFNPVIRHTEDELRTVMETFSSDLTDDEAPAYQWFIEWEGQLVGTVTLKEVSRTQKYGELGYGVAEKFHGQGIGTAAVRALIDKIFRETDLYRLQAFIAENNLASRRLVTKLGFQQEGCLREHYIVQGRRVNEVLYGLLRPEWLSCAP